MTKEVNLKAKRRFSAVFTKKMSLLQGILKRRKKGP
jgi:hypothetical protein